MTAAPFRDLFVELPRAVFESLQAIGEAAVARASQATAAPAVPPAWRPPWWRTEYAWRVIAQRRGVAEVELQYDPIDPHKIEVVFRRRCGHPGRGHLDVRDLVMARPEAIDALDRAFDRAERTCQCMERPA